jgi:hypothetical protein
VAFVVSLYSWKPLSYAPFPCIIQKQEKIAPEKIVMITTKQPTDKEADVSVHHLTPPAGLHCLFHSDGPLN